MVNTSDTENILEPAYSDGQKSLGEEGSYTQGDKTRPVSDLRMGEKCSKWRDDTEQFVRNGRHCGFDGERGLPSLSIDGT
jgi:hypothetical protein